MIKFLCLFMFFSTLNAVSQIRVTYKLKTDALNEQQSTHDIFRLVKEMSEEFKFFLDVKSGKSHFYLDEGMGNDSNPMKVNYKSLALVQYVSGEEFWSDAQSGKAVVFAADKFVSSNLETPAWKILSDTKKIDRYDCFKADYTYEFMTHKGNLASRTITAWFAPELPYSFGPSSYFGLPGLILELHDGQETTYFATEISRSAAIPDIVLPQKVIDRDTYESQLKENSERLRRK